MSFAKDAKQQILNKQIEKNCCAIAFISGLLHVSGEFSLSKKSLSIITDVPQVFPYCNKILGRLYGDYAEMAIENEFKINKVTYYRITLPSDNLPQMLQDFGLIDKLGNFNIDGINNKMLQSECCIKSFVKGVFIGSATSGIRLSEKQTEKTSSGYDIEFIARSHNFLLDFSEILAQFNMFPKIIKRKNNYVLYLKESNAVCDLLAMVEAFDSVLQLQNELAVRELRNKVNRQTNCLNANISKTVEASLNQLNAIEIIGETVGFDAISADLQEVALLRLANPEESLGDLLKLATFETTKSALNHRLNKLIKIANNLK